MLSPYSQKNTIYKVFSFSGHVFSSVSDNMRMVTLISEAIVLFKYCNEFECLNCK